MASKEIIEAVKKALENNNKKRKFTQSIDMVINLKDVDLSKPDNRIDEEIELPKGRGREAKVGVFASGEMAARAKDVADMVIMPEEIKELAEDKKKAKEIANEYDFFVAEAPLMPSIGKALGRVFAPRGKMPKPVAPNADIESIVKKLKRSVRIRSKDKPTFHCLIGREDMKVDEIAENVEAVLMRVEEKLERGRTNIKSAYIKTTMGSATRVI